VAKQLALDPEASSLEDMGPDRSLKSMRWNPDPMKASRAQNHRHVERIKPGATGKVGLHARQNATMRAHVLLGDTGKRHALMARARAFSLAAKFKHLKRALHVTPPFAQFSRSG